MPSRRAFLQTAFAGLAIRPGSTPIRQVRNSRSTFLDIRRPPDLAIVQTADGEHRLERDAADWRADDVRVAFDRVDGALRVRLSAPASAVGRLRFRWSGDT